MSISLMTMAWKADLPSGPKMVLLSLCDNANDQGECYPSISMIAQRCSMSDRVVYKYIALLEEKGAVVRQNRAGRSTVYTLDPCTVCTPAPRAPITVIEPSFESSIEPSFDISRAQASDQTAAATPPPKPDKPEKRAHRLPAGFAPDATAQQLASQLGVDLAAELLAFSDHHAARASRFADWQAALRTWLRNAARYAARAAPPSARRSGAGAAQKSFAQQDREAGMARWEAMTGRIHPDRALHAAGAGNAAVVIDVAATQTHQPRLAGAQP